MNQFDKKRFSLEAQWRQDLSAKRNLEQKRQSLIKEWMPGGKLRLLP